MTLQIVQDEAADEVLSTNAFALLCGMLLQQQAAVDVAFAGPAKILDRFGSLDPVSISEAAPDEFAELCATEPPVHPYPESMAVLVQALARFIVVNYDGDTAAVWNTAGSGEHLLSRLTLMPGFGRRMAQMFVALLGRQLDIRPPGWEEAAGPYAQEGGYRSVADVHDKASLERVLNAKTGRRKGDTEAGDGRTADRTSAHTQESTGSTIVNTEEVTAAPADDATESDEKRAARKAARKSARQAQRREARQAAAGSGSADESVPSGDADSYAQNPVSEDGETKERLSPEQRAERKAEKAEKRAARRAAAGKEPDAEAGREGRRGGRRGRGGRNRGEGDSTEAVNDSVSTDGTVSADDTDTPATADTADPVQQSQ